jgi:hypothetical protein
MDKTFDQGKDEIARLCRYFSSNRLAFLAPGIKEAHVRQSLIDPLFEALGWDVRNAAMVAPQYREVVPEAAWTSKASRKRPITRSGSGLNPNIMPKPRNAGSTSIPILVRHISSGGMAGAPRSRSRF